MKRLLLGTLLFSSACHAVSLCDTSPDDARCRPLELHCATDKSPPHGRRIDLTRPFSIYAQDLDKQALAAQAAQIQTQLQLEFLDGSEPQTTALLNATALVPENDDELRVSLTDTAKQSLSPRRGGLARIEVKLGRWTGELAEDEAQNGCAFVVEPRYDATAGHRFDAQRKGLRQLGARLFAGPRTDCSVAEPRCPKSAALYASYYEGEPSTPCLQLERFVLDAKLNLLSADTRLPGAFRAIRPDNRLKSMGAAVVASGTQLVLRSNATRLAAVSSTTYGELAALDSPPLPMHTAVSGAFEQPRFFLAIAGNVSVFSLPVDATGATQLRLNPTALQTYRMFERAQLPWAAAPQPDLLLLGDAGAVQLPCEEGLTQACAALQSSAQAKLSGASYADARLADMDADGLQDLVVLDDATKVVSWLPQLRDGSFGDARALDGIPASGAFAIADFDGDGLLDVAVLLDTPASSGAELSVFLNQALPAPAGS